jgi:hypothetical protein
MAFPGTQYNFFVLDFITSNKFACQPQYLKEPIIKYTRKILENKYLNKKSIIRSLTSNKLKTCWFYAQLINRGGAGII